MFELQTHCIGIVSDEKFQRFVANVQKKLMYGGCDQYGTISKYIENASRYQHYAKCYTILVQSSE